jgi:hypothetical protein
MVPIAPLRSRGSKLGVGLYVSTAAVEKRRHGRDVVTGDVANEVDDVHAEIDQTTATGPTAVEEPFGSQCPGLRARVPERGAETGHRSETACRDEPLGGYEGRCEAQVLERH